MATRTVAPQDLVTLGTGILAAVGVPAADARLVADSLVQADLWGHQSHGVLRLPWYAARLAAARWRADRAGRRLRHRPAGAARRARRHRPGAHRARPSDWRSSGPAPTASAGSASATPTTSARPMYFTRRAAEDGCVGRPDHERQPGDGAVGRAGEGVGTNPWSIAAPGPDGAASSRSTSPTPPSPGARSTWRRTAARRSRRRGRSTPTGPDDRPGGGRARRDPADGRPQGLRDHVHDGRAGRRPDRQRRRYRRARPVRGRAAQRVRALPDGRRRRRDAVRRRSPSRMEALVAQTKANPAAPGVDEIFVPGEIEQRNAARNAAGITLPTKTWDDLSTLAAETGVAMPAAHSNGVLTDARPRCLPAGQTRPPGRLPRGHHRAGEALVHRRARLPVRRHHQTTTTSCSDELYTDRVRPRRPPRRAALRRLAAGGCRARRARQPGQHDHRATPAPPL